MSQASTPSVANQTAHTPGPWTVHRHPAEPGAFTVIDQHDEFVAWSRDLLKPDAECEANARLIAAAPELLAGAYATLRYALNHSHDCEGMADATKGCACYLDDLCTAINKATGR